MKHCPKCGRDLPEEAFQKNSTAKDGLQFYCKDCMHVYDKKRQQKARQIPQELSKYTPRQLMEELHRRGYKGTLTYEQHIDIEKL